MLLASSIAQLVMTVCIVLVGVTMVAIIALIAFMLVYMAVEKLVKDHRAHARRGEKA